MSTRMCSWLFLVVGLVTVLANGGSPYRGDQAEFVIGILLIATGLLIRSPQKLA